LEFLGLIFTKKVFQSQKSLSFLCVFVNVFLVLSSSWMVSSRKSSMSLALGQTYWKGLFAQCTSHGAHGFHCDDYEVPWFQFDSLVLSSRIMMIFAISFAVLAHAVYFISGNWNWVLSGLDEKVKKWLARTASILYFLSGSFLIIVSGLFTDIILRAYANDSKMGPTHSIGMVQHDENLVRYEFGACLYLGYVFGGLQLILAVSVWLMNPHVGEKDEKEDYSRSFQQDYLSVY